MIVAVLKVEKSISVIKSGLCPIERPVVSLNDVYGGVWGKWELYKYTRNTRKSYYVTATKVIKKNALARGYALNIKAKIWKLFFQCRLYRYVLRLAVV